MAQPQVRRPFTAKDRKIAENAATLKASLSQANVFLINFEHSRCSCWVYLTAAEEEFDGSALCTQERSKCPTKPIHTKIRYGENPRDFEFAFDFGNS